MTGGNRAKGIGTNKSNYENGDTPSETYIRRAPVYTEFGANEYLLHRYIGVTGQGGRPGSGDISIIRKLTPYNLQNFNHETGANRSGIWFHIGPWNGFGHKFSMAAELETINRPIGDSHINGKSTSKLLGLGDNEKQVFNQVIKACSDSNLLESNCQPNSLGHFKPEGVMQEYSKQMRFALFGYTWRGGTHQTDQDGGVMRSRLKLIGQDSTIQNKSGSKNYKLGQEINPTTGQFVLNPDEDDANTSGVENSGIINYVNKFAERNPYRYLDYGSRMYYPALRYVRGMSNPSKYTAPFTTPQSKDYFPVIADWDDPIKRDALNGCKRKNVMLAIGDTNINDHAGPAGFKPPGYGSLVSDDPVNYKTWTKKAIDHEKATGTFNGGVGENHETWGIPIIGMAYYAHTNNLRPDLPNFHTTAETVTIDIVEYRDYKWNYNAYWMAGKYGGFTDVNGDGKPGPDRSEWTEDPAGASSFSALLMLLKRLLIQQAKSLLLKHMFLLRLSRGGRKIRINQL